MCFKKPKTPKVEPDPELVRQQQDAKIAAQAERSAAKKSAFEDALGRATGRQGRSALLSGGAGGRGFGAIVRRLLQVDG